MEILYKIIFFWANPPFFPPVNSTLQRKNSWFKRVYFDQGESKKESYDAGLSVLSLAYIVD